MTRRARASPGVERQQRAVRALRPVAARSSSTSSGCTGLRTFSELIAAHGTRPRLRHLQAGRRLDPRLARHRATSSTASRRALQDTNDHVMANLQKDGTYSVVPRIPGGEITPEELIAIGEVAQDFGLYTKITGGQRIDLFGARIEQLPAIWQRLVDAGFESGHAYGKSLRTVKSCVGSTWCRYGVQDSVGLAIALELRYRGLRSPHKIKLGRLRLRARVRRGPRQGRRRHRHRQGLEPLRRRQRRLHAHATPSCSPRTSTPRRWSGRSTGSSCTTSAPPTGCSAPRRGSRATRAGSRRSARSSSTTPSASRADLDAAMAAPRRRLRGRVGRDARRPREARAVRRPSSTRPTTADPDAGLRRRARPAPARHARRARRDGSSPGPTLEVRR